MATILSHAVAAVAIGGLFPTNCVARRIWAVGAYCSIVPDCDVIGFAFGIRYGDFWGHRGFTHSLCFAALAALFVTFIVLRRRRPKHWILLYLFLAIASHGLLDALTDGGLGVAFFSPFDNSRYFFPTTPIHVSPIGAAFFSEYGIRVLLNEMLWIWIPAAIVLSLGLWLHRDKRPLTIKSPDKNAA